MSKDPIKWSRLNYLRPTLVIWGNQLNSLRPNQHIKTTRPDYLVLPIYVTAMALNSPSHK